jgi:two-component system, cell cycle response regulator
MKVLIAEDDRTTTAVLSHALERLGLQVIVAHDGESAWAQLESDTEPALGIIDWVMPGVDGVELCRRIRARPALAGMYLILLTGRDKPADLIAGLDAGADDYVIKPFDAHELQARVKVGMRIARLQAGLAQRVADLQVARDHLAQLASTDVLTELYTRRRWFELASAEFSRCRRYHRPFSVLVVDLDFFKQVNDTFGHDGGDALLQQFGKVLRQACRKSDIIGRLGGEEFGILVPETAVRVAQVAAARINEACRRIELSRPEGRMSVSCSIGISGLASSDESVETVLRRADAALYEAKRAGRDCWKVQNGEAARRP